jgi:hypothetical protein
MSLKRLRSACSVVLLALLFTAPPALAATDGAATVNALADELLTQLRETSAYVRMQSGLPIRAFDPITLVRAQEEAKFSKRMLARLDAVALEKLPHDQWLLAKMLRHTFASGTHADENYWFDFAVTPYASGLNIAAMWRAWSPSFKSISRLCPRHLTASCASRSRRKRV